MERACIFSFIRYLRFDGDVIEGEISELRVPCVEQQRLFVQRSARLLFHEIGHAFGLLHCVYYECCMRGTNSIEESDSTPIFLCPIDLRKLFFSVRRRAPLEVTTTPVDRYKQLLMLCKASGLHSEVDWLTMRIAMLESG